LSYKAEGILKENPNKVMLELIDDAEAAYYILKEVLKSENMWLGQPEDTG
jgi:hypothetical protein